MAKERVGRIIPHPLALPGLRQSLGLIKKRLFCNFEAILRCP
jgi:hypothetical protein